ncbi:TPA: acyltransferase [Burkholderia cenocepacia]|nr:acyltransferase [Burkholderia cenocepacia]HEP6426875.1 acyltransferase [Burkholderia cenocepacia]
MLVVYRHFLDSYLPLNTTTPWPIGASILAEGGGLGVSLFCVVSGFIFEYIVRGQRIKYWTFLQARMWRIYPLYVISLFLGTLIYKGSYVGLVEQLLFMVPTASAGLLFGHTWSIAVEFQFYLIFPFLTLILARHGSRQLLLLLAFILLMRALLWANGYDVNMLGYWSIGGRADQFLLGMLAGKVYVDGRAKNFGSWTVFSFSLVLLAAVTQWFHLSYGAMFPWEQKPMTAWLSIIWPTIQAVCFAMIVLSFLTLRVNIPQFIEKPLFYIGTISFSIYIVHRIVEFTIADILHHRVLNITGLTKPDAMLTCTAVEIPILICVASLAYYAIELPFQEFKKSYKVDLHKNKTESSLTPVS